MKPETLAGFTGAHFELIAASETSVKTIPPLWPLSSSVAVNPFLGQSGKTLVQAASLLERVGGVAVTMPHAWYQERIANGTITDADLSAALAAAPSAAPDSIDELKALALAPDPAIRALPTIAHLAQEASGLNWPGLIAERIGTWAAGYFDTGQALWQATSGRDAFESWQTFASRDLTPEIAGLAGFAARVAEVPVNARVTLSLACDALEVKPDAATTYFHQLLLDMGGWSQAARQRLWQAELAGTTDTITTDMLTIRLVWEQALLSQYSEQIEERWSTVRAFHASDPSPSAEHSAASILQEAAERAAQRGLAAILSGPAQEKATGRPALQAAFCIDVRSEVFRRALESLDPAIETIGFAGFFGLTPAHRSFASDLDEARLPVLLSAGLQSTDKGEDNAQADDSARLAARAERAWGRFKLAAVSSFAFVEATGPVYVGKLVRDALSLPHTGKTSSPQPRFTDDFAVPDRITAATTILRAMSMTENFAPVVLMVGHGASVVNNPHASALHCGACGGYKGDVNARLLADMLNDTEVRAGLAQNAIPIPDDTVFVGALHDTTTDGVIIFDEGVTAPALGKARGWLDAATSLARTERALRLPRADTGSAVTRRSTDWAETRPEWALAGCSAFIAAPRSRTRGKALAGRAFLHDYDWQKDEGFGILELILTAPVVVASWISLQYYGSVVAPDTFGAGNKLLHNVTGGFGVVEGNGGTLRTGLPWQSVHDGDALAHDPLRLSVCVEAPVEAMSEILTRHPDVRALFDNRWLHLFSLGSTGQLEKRYAGDLEWRPFG